MIIKYDVNEYLTNNKDLQKAYIEEFLFELKRLEAENEKLKSRNKLYKKIIKENIEKANNNFMILTACIQGNLSIDEVKQYAKFQEKNNILKAENKQLKKDIQSRIMCISCNRELQNCNLLAENEKLKEKLHKHTGKNYCECEFSNNLVQENERLKEEKGGQDILLNNYIEHCQKYKQALEDIRTELLQNSCANSKEIRNILAIIDEVLK